MGSMVPRSRLLIVAYALVIVVGIGIAGYMVIEGWSFLDAAYMTVVTLSTVGYREVHVLSSAGRVFSIFLIVAGVGIMLYTMTTIVQYIFEVRIGSLWGRRRMQDKISKLRNHVILCGYGLVGREVARVFGAEGVPFVIIDQDPQAVALAIEAGYLVLSGDATVDDTLESAGITQARALVAALGSDADNVYVTLTAREKRPDLFIVARASSSESERKLLRAGANRTMSPYGVGGRRLALLTLRPVVVDFVDTTMSSLGGELMLENIHISADSPIVGKTIGESRRQAGGATILAIKKGNGRLLANPPHDTRLDVDDQIVVIGTRGQLRVLEGSVQ